MGAGGARRSGEAKTEGGGSLDAVKVEFSSRGLCECIKRVSSQLLQQLLLNSWRLTPLLLFDCIHVNKLPCFCVSFSF